jgi:hypothetical protein
MALLRAVLNVILNTVNLNLVLPLMVRFKTERAISLKTVSLTLLIRMDVMVLALQQLTSTPSSNFNSKSASNLSSAKMATS